jgi:hypothetical protein
MASHLVSEFDSVPGESKAACVKNGLQSTSCDFALGQAVKIVHIVLQAAIEMCGCRGDGLGQQWLSAVCIAYGVRGKEEGVIPLTPLCCALKVAVGPSL